MSRPANIMIDLETLDSKPGALILSIGACEVLPPEEMKDAKSFYCKCFDNSNRFTISEETVKWWMQYPETFLKLTSDGSEAREYRRDIETQLRALSTWIMAKVLKEWKIGPLSDSDLLVWGDGADFDIIVLEEAMRRIGIDIPWTYISHRCYRTLRNLIPECGEKRDYIAPEDLHNAEKDAIGQATHLSKLLDHMGYWNDYGKKEDNRSS